MKQIKFTKESTRTRTKEWADKNINIGLGCAHGCKYCYAMGVALRFNRIPNSEAWATERVNTKALLKGYQSKGCVVMFPTTHDITPYYLPYAVETLKKILDSNNKVLIVSKPHIDCIQALCSELGAYKAQILYRFTIGTLDPEVSKFWEPGAPLPEERIKALRHAHLDGFSTGVSIEPMLGGVESALQTFHAVSPYVSDIIWLGKMNQRAKFTAPDDITAAKNIKELQRDSEILRLVSILGSNPKSAWKDSIRKVLMKDMVMCLTDPNYIREMEIADMNYIRF